jgi:hypothetical protein
MMNELEAILGLSALAVRFSMPEEMQNRLELPSTWGILFSWLFVHALGKVVSRQGFEEQSRSWMDEWRLSKTIADVLMDFGQEAAGIRPQEVTAWNWVAVIKLLTSHQHWFETSLSSQNPAYRALESLLNDGEVHQFLQVNRYNDILWFNKEAFGELQCWLFLVAVIEISSDPMHTANEVEKDLKGCTEVLQRWQEAERKSGYQLERLLQEVRG